MSEGMNRVTLIGNLGQDPDLKRTQTGQPVLNLSLATTESFFDSNTKERKERTEWHRVTIWGARGEALSKILTKGSRICVEGRLQTRSWEKDGEKRYSTDINAQNVILLGGKSRGERQDDNREPSHGSAGNGSESFGGDQSYSESDIPF